MAAKFAINYYLNYRIINGTISSFFVWYRDLSGASSPYMALQTILNLVWASRSGWYRYVTLP